MVAISIVAVAALLSSTAYAWTGHDAPKCRSITPTSSSKEDTAILKDPNVSKCFTLLNICMGYYHPSPSELYITLTNKAHNAFVCLSDENGWRSCVQTSAGVPCNAGVPVNAFKIYTSLYPTLS
ncbi:hypothetical protein BFW01_g8917 [Lasiodiplodia theobromae]|uniref:uncharacterized protein n=1 Tax=Lasiodiplodia theobromae TaxID=45133 RepID=UPI0015C2FD35|nr:uncharacterized protein LTHEOB_9419 [Lasiodiplodia theobromae]KAF4540323.1 hypothetical protein LTHEOB_9419 [Lasiodiplodia theobromae]KAF9638020.1 hypothetical protein BFW01_g8917 [Lasiodiplodia theobromae]